MLSLWVENQVGVDSDFTANYIAAARWTPPNGVELAEQTLRGVDPALVYAAFVELRNRVAEEIDAMSNSPSLVACMESDVHVGHTSAKITLTRLASAQHDNYESFRKACGDR